MNVGKSNTGIGTTDIGSPLPYRGRFAPSPTGPLHFGSLVAAVGSYLSARQAGGEWLVRIEDLDPPREIPGSAEEILSTLRSFGFEWTESTLYQSDRRDAYEAAVQRLIDSGLAYPCSCSRRELQAVQPGNRADGDELHYPGWCRNGVRAPQRRLALRFRAGTGAIGFDDAVQGYQTFDIAADVGDFIVRRRDELHAYQLAVTIDDAFQNISHVVRGADLLTSTPRQIALQRALALPTTMYAHLPVAIDANGIKLSKSTGAAAIDTREPARELWRALSFLRQKPPPELCRTPVPAVWEWAIEHWHVQSVHAVRQAVAGDPP